MKKVILISILLFFTNIFAKECQLPRGEVLHIACTKKCARTYINALYETAQELGYNIDIYTLNYSSDRDFANLPNRIDGIISPGGHDIDPRYYTRTLPPQKASSIKREFLRYGKTNYEGRKRDSYEYKLFKHYFNDDSFKDMPVLGICYGMQMLASVKNIPLYVDIKRDLNIPPRRKTEDKIYIKRDSSLIDYIGNRYFYGYKNHHQAIDLDYYNTHKSRYSDVKISATSNQGEIAEIIEFDNRPAIGVQFHPERSQTGVKRAIMRKFLTDACKKRLNQTRYSNKDEYQPEYDTPSYNSDYSQKPKRLYYDPATYHLGDEEFRGRRWRRLYGRCYRASFINHDYHKSYFLILDKFGVESTKLSLNGYSIAPIPRQYKARGRRPNFWEDEEIIRLPDRYIQKGRNTLTICSSEVSNPDHRYDLDDLQIRNIMIVAK